MKAMEIQPLVDYLDAFLRLAEVPDYPGALNGLQVASDGPVTRLAAAVDASEASVREAIERGCDFLLVHHGLFWDGNRPVTGRRYRRLAPLLRSGVGLYSAHLPLDVHPEVGNNAVLARHLEIGPGGRFADYQGEPLGVWGEVDWTPAELEQRVRTVLGGAVHMVRGGPERIRRVGVITGGGGGMIGAALAAGLDALVTGEGSHHTYFDATEGGLHVCYGGHYATETWGVRALAEHLEARFSLPWEFLDLPTGL